MEADSISFVFIELGLVIIGLAVLTRLASRWGLSAIPFYLLAGLSFGNGGLLPLRFSEDFVHVGAEIGVALLLFMLGLQYSAKELVTNVRSGFANGILDLLLNFSPGLLVGIALGWDALSSLLLGGITYVSSSGIISKILQEIGWHDKKAASIVSVLVIEDLAMAVYLPVIAVLLVGGGIGNALISMLASVVTVSLVLLAVLRYGDAISRIVLQQADEVIVFITLGLILFVAGVAQSLQISAAVGAFLVGIALSGPIVERARNLLSPMRDLFAAIFFLFFGLQVDPGTLPPFFILALGLGIVTALTKIITGYFANSRGTDIVQRFKAGRILVARGEFSIVIAGLGVSAGLEPELGALATAYVLLMAVIGPILARLELPVRRC